MGGLFATLIDTLDALDDVIAPDAAAMTQKNVDSTTEPVPSQQPDEIPGCSKKAGTSNLQPTRPGSKLPDTAEQPVRRTAILCVFSA